jgi:recombination associated protein RdgC
MLFKNAIIYLLTESIPQLTGLVTIEPVELASEMNEKAFEPCRSQELSRFGWIPPHPNLDSYFFISNDAFLICAQKEEKILPSAVIKKALKDRVNIIEREQARKVYRKEQLQLKDEIILDLLPHAFSKFRNTYALIMPKHGMIIVDAGNHKQAEELLSLLRNTLGTLPIKLPDTVHSPSVVMSEWMESAKTPEGFELQDKCLIRRPDESGGAISIGGEDLTSTDVVAHIESGYQVTKMALLWDSTFSFTLHEDLRMTGIKPTDELSQALNDESSEDPLQRLDADVARLSLEYAKLVPAVLGVFGGEVKR